MAEGLADDADHVVYPLPASARRTVARAKGEPRPVLPPDR
jgi:hypothetical protein